MVDSTWKKQLNFLWIGQVCILATLAMSTPYWPLYIEQLGQFSPKEVRFWSAAICVGPFITAILSAPLWGKVGDRFGYKPMVLRACFGIFITQALILLFSDVVFILAARLLQGILGGFIVSAQTWALAMSPVSERSSTLGKLQSATALSTMTGPLLGGLIAAFGGYDAIFIGSTFVAGGVTFFFFFFLKDVTKSDKPKAAPETTDNASTKNSFFNPNILIILLVISMIQLAEQMITPVFALFVADQLGGKEILVGFLFAAPGIMIFALASYWGKFFDRMTRSGRSLHYFIAFFLFASALLQVLHVYADTAISVFALRLLWGVCLGALLPMLLRFLIDNINQADRGVFLGFGNSATKLGTVLGILSGAVIEAHFGYDNSFLIMGLLYFISGVIILWGFKCDNARSKYRIAA